MMYLFSVIVLFVAATCTSELYISKLNYIETGLKYKLSLYDAEQDESSMAGFLDARESYLKATESCLVGYSKIAETPVAESLREAYALLLAADAEQYSRLLTLPVERVAVYDFPDEIDQRRVDRELVFSNLLSSFHPKIEILPCAALEAAKSALEAFRHFARGFPINDTCADDKRDLEIKLWGISGFTSRLAFAVDVWYAALHEIRTLVTPHREIYKAISAATRSWLGLSVTASGSSTDSIGRSLAIADSCAEVLSMASDYLSGSAFQEAQTALLDLAAVAHDSVTYHNDLMFKQTKALASKSRLSEMYAKELLVLRYKRIKYKEALNVARKAFDHLGAAEIDYAWEELLKAFSVEEENHAILMNAKPKRDRNLLFKNFFEASANVENKEEVFFLLLTSTLHDIYRGPEIGSEPSISQIDEFVEMVKRVQAETSPVLAALAAADKAYTQSDTAYLVTRDGVAANADFQIARLRLLSLMPEVRHNFPDFLKAAVLISDDTDLSEKVKSATSLWQDVLQHRRVTREDRSQIQSIVAFLARLLEILEVLKYKYLVRDEARVFIKVLHELLPLLRKSHEAQIGYLSGSMTALDVNAAWSEQQLLLSCLEGLKLFPVDTLFDLRGAILIGRRAFLHGENPIKAFFLVQEGWQKLLFTIRELSLKVLMAAGSAIRVVEIIDVVSVYSKAEREMFDRVKAEWTATHKTEPPGASLLKAFTTISTSLWKVLEYRRRTITAKDHLVTTRLKVLDDELSQLDGVHQNHDEGFRQLTRCFRAQEEKLCLLRELISKT